MQQLLLAPVPGNKTNQNNVLKLNVKPADIVIPPPNKQKENQKPAQSPMIPTAAFKILKRGEPFPQKPKSPVKDVSTNNSKQQVKPEIIESKPQTSQMPKALLEVKQASPKKVEQKPENKQIRKSKKSESEKSQISTKIESSEESLALDTTQSSLDITQSSGTGESEISLNIEAEKPESHANAPTPVQGGIKIDPLQLISSIAAPSFISPIKSSSASPKKMAPQRSLSVNDQPVDKPQQFEKFGDFKSFTEKQAPTPCNLNSRNQRTRGSTRSPSGVPTTDFANGYGKIHRKNRELDVRFFYCT